MTKNSAVSLCRVFSMFLIILCHIIHLYTFIPGSQSLGEVFNVGVYTFFAISGYLYGKKKIKRFGSWLLQRAMKIMLPASILSVCVFMGIAAVKHEFDIVSFGVYILNLQGLAFILPIQWIFFEQQSAIVPLWFITIIMLCYCTIPGLQRLRERFSEYHIWVLIMFILLTGICYGVGVFCGIYLFHFLTFFIGYCFGHFGESGAVKILPFAGDTAVVLALQVARLYLRVICDGTVYYQSYVGVSHMALGVWILLFFFWIQKCFPELTKRLSRSRCINMLDNISLYVYMTHSVFIVTDLSPYRYTDNLLISTVLFVVSSFISAILLRWLSEHSYKLFFQNFELFYVQKV